MKIELIPVVEITYWTSATAPSHDKYPYWEHQEDWAQYVSTKLKNAGFEDEFEPYAQGLSFFEPSKISLSNLKKLILDKFEPFDDSDFDCFFPFYGGYVLRVNDKDVYFPQCCGDLGDIAFWKIMILEKKSCHCHGHPHPQVFFTDTEVQLSFEQEHEEFDPPVPLRLTLNIESMKAALNEALSKLKKFEESILLAQAELNIDLKNESIIDMLIYHNDEVES